ncbi:tryptophan synthase beta subunit-like PLP-dependent enzyme, partial [Martensiomyces pterosporus]
LHVPTPLLYSTSMSKQAGCNVWLKLENLQPTQSFKIRGVGNFCTKAVLERGATRLVTVGDTNAALAVAYSGRQLGVPVTIFVPSGMQASVARAKIELEGAEIIEKGRTVKDASDAAHVFVHETAGAIVVGAADDTAVIAGNATIATEINVQLQQKEPAVIITVVGSGGHLAGLLSGLQRCHWQSVPVIAVETHNTNSFQQALLADTKLPGSTPTAGSSNGGKKKSKPGSLPNEDRGRSGNDRSLEPTVATCLLSGSICPSALELSKTHPVVPVSVSEAMAAEACRRLLDDHQLLVEIGSAAALSIVGKGLVHQIVPDLDCNSHVVVIVTGGANISFDRLEACRQ